MENSDVVSLLPSVADRSRFRLIVLRDVDQEPRIQIIDRERDALVFEWSGHVARHIVNTGALVLENDRRCACYPCDKEVVWHLALVAAAARCLYSRLPNTHRRVANVLWNHSSEHLTSDEVQLIMAADNNEPVKRETDSCLADLVKWGVIQQIEIDRDNVFFDVDTRPHDHIFDPQARRIYDA